MPALPPVPQVIRFVLKYTFAADTDVINRFYVRYSGTAPDNSALTGWAGGVGTAWVTNMAPMSVSAVQLTSITLTDLTSSTAGQGVNSSVHPGTRVGATLPAGACALFDFHVQRRYRGGKPRMYLPVGAAADLNSAQAWSAAFITSLQTAFNNFFAGIQGTAPSGTTVTNQVSVSYYSGFTVHTGSTGRAHNVSTPRATPIVDVVTSGAVDPRLATQRRRQRP